MIPLISLLVLLFSPPNDAVFTGSGGNLHPTHMTNLSLQKEVLTLTFNQSTKELLVDVVFIVDNPDTFSVDTIGFVTPPMFNDGFNPPARPEITNFFTEVNNKAVPNSFTRLDSTEFIGSSIQGKATDYVYFFIAELNPGTNTIHHSYRYRGTLTSLLQQYFQYRLTTVKYWSNQSIEDFEIIFKPGNGFFTLPGCFSKNCNKNQWKVYGRGAIKKHSSGDVTLFSSDSSYFILRADNFQPEKDLTISTGLDILFGNGYYCISSYDHKTLDSSALSQAIANFPPFSEPTSWKPYLESIDKPTLRLFRNFFFAIEGHDFSDEYLREYFSQYFWYVPIPGKKVVIEELKDKPASIVKAIRKIEKP